MLREDIEVATHHKRSNRPKARISKRGRINEGKPPIAPDLPPVEPIRVHFKEWHLEVRNILAQIPAGDRAKAMKGAIASLKKYLKSTD